MICQSKVIYYAINFASLIFSKFSLFWRQFVVRVINKMTMEERVPLFLCKKEGQVLFCTRPSRPCEKRNNFIDCGSIQSFLGELRTHEPIKDLLIDVCIFQTLNFVDVLINFNFLRLQTSMNNLSKN